MLMIAAAALHRTRNSSTGKSIAGAVRCDGVRTGV